MGRQRIQEGPFGNPLEGQPLRRGFSRQGYRSGEGVSTFPIFDPHLHISKLHVDIPIRQTEPSLLFLYLVLSLCFVNASVYQWSVRVTRNFLKSGVVLIWYNKLICSKNRYQTCVPIEVTLLPVYCDLLLCESIIDLLWNAINHNVVVHHVMVDLSNNFFLHISICWLNYSPTLTMNLELVVIQSFYMCFSSHQHNQ